MGTKMLALISKPASGDGLKRTVGDEAADALQTFPADEIVLFTHAGAERTWAEEGLVEHAREGFNADVHHMLVER
jgi:hypothetical protein